MKQQSLDNQKAEIEFRKKLVMQQVEGIRVFDTEFDARGIESLLDARMTKTLNQMTLRFIKNMSLFYFFTT